MIKVSEQAKKKVIELMNDDGFITLTTDYIRVGVKSGGCSGLSYDLKFDKSKQEGERSLKITVSKSLSTKRASYTSLVQRLEYSGGLNGTGLYLIIQMPTALVVVENHFHFKKT
jgi:iron-sulfur cluster assembly protein